MVSSVSACDAFDAGHDVVDDAPGAAVTDDENPFFVEDTFCNGRRLMDEALFAKIEGLRMRSLSLEAI